MVGGADPHAQRARHVEGPGIDPTALGGGRRQRFAGHEALVDLRSAFDNSTVNRNALARADQHHLPRPKGGDGYLRELMSVHEFGGGLRAQGGEIAGNSARAPAHRLFEGAPDQQEGEQHQGRVEIGVLGMMPRLDDRHAERQKHAHRDRHVHVEPAGHDRADRRLEERTTRVGGGRQCDEGG